MMKTPENIGERTEKKIEENLAVPSSPFSAVDFVRNRYGCGYSGLFCGLVCVSGTSTAEKHLFCIALVLYFGLHGYAAVFLS